MTRIFVAKIEKIFELSQRKKSINLNSEFSPTYILYACQFQIQCVEFALDLIQAISTAEKFSNEQWHIKSDLHVVFMMVKKYAFCTIKNKFLQTIKQAHRFISIV